MTDQEIEIACFGKPLAKPQPWQTQALAVLIEMNKTETGRFFLQEAIDKVKSTALLRSVQTKGTFDTKKLKKVARTLSDASRNPSAEGL